MKLKGRRQSSRVVDMRGQKPSIREAAHRAAAMTSYPEEYEQRASKIPKKVHKDMDGALSRIRRKGSNPFAGKVQAPKAPVKKGRVKKK